VTCMTLHHLLPRLLEPLRGAVVSVADVLVSCVGVAGPGPHLLLCSRAARDVRLFERHPGWSTIEHSIVLPDLADNHSLQEAIHDIKVNKGHRRAREWLAAAVVKYHASSVVVGCSEIHVLAKDWPADSTVTWVDPFDAIAEAVATDDINRLLTVGIK
jgi:aspartate racemase